MMYRMGSGKHGKSLALQKAEGCFPNSEQNYFIKMLSEAGSLIYKANETNMQVIQGKQISLLVVLININNIQSALNTTAILRNDGTIDIVPSQHEKLQNPSTITQAVLYFLNTALIIFTPSHR